MHRLVRRYSSARLVLLLLSLPLLASCSSSLFIPYPKRMTPVRQALAAGDYTDASAAVKPYVGSNDSTLYLLEYGRIEQLAGNYKNSLTAFKQAIKETDEQRDKADITVTGTAVQGGSLLLNDNLIPYTSYPYEIILLHQYQALNYLALGDISGALVEVRRADSAQTALRRKHQAALDAANQTASEKSVSPNVDWSKPAFRYINTAAAKVNSQFLNAYSYYFGGVLYEATGKANDAYIDYKQALRIAPTNPYLQQVVLRLAKQLGMRQEYQHYHLQYPQAIKHAGVGQGQLIVLFEQGFIPERTQFSLIFPINRKLVRLALPLYLSDSITTTPLVINYTNSTNTDSTMVLLNLQNLSARALKDNYPVIVLREILRILAKATVSTQASQTKNDLANQLIALVSSAYNVFTEAADLRNWLTLPNDVQIAQRFLPSGKQQITLHYQQMQQPISVKILPGHITLLWAVGYSNRLETKTFVL